MGEPQWWAVSEPTEREWRGSPGCPGPSLQYPERAGRDRKPSLVSAGEAKGAEFPAALESKGFGESSLEFCQRIKAPLGSCKFHCL